MEFEENRIIERLINNIDNLDYTLFNGKSGILLTLSYCYRYESDEKLKKQIKIAIEKCIDQLFSDIENYPMGGSLSNGITGIAYSLEVARKKGDFPQIEDEWMTQIDEVIINSLREFLKLKEFDLFRGASGIIVYLLKNHKKNIGAIEKYIDSLEESAIWTSNHSCYWVFYSYNEASQQLEYRKDIVNTGLAHGMASIISILSELYNKGYLKNKCYRLIEGALNFLKSVQNFNGISQFNGIIYFGKKEQDSSRLGWCYGDSSVALSIIKAGIYCKNKGWLDYGNKIGLESALRRTIENAGLEEHGICHGYFGAMHIYNRLHHATGLPEYLEKKEYWYAKGMENRDFDISESGFFQTELNQNRMLEKFTTPSLLMGLSGIVLCLSSYQEIHYTWDDVFLTNI